MQAWDLWETSCAGLKHGATPRRSNSKTEAAGPRNLQGPKAARERGERERERGGTKYKSEREREEDQQHIAAPATGAWQRWLVQGGPSLKRSHVGSKLRKLRPTLHTSVATPGCCRSPLIRDMCCPVLQNGTQLAAKLCSRIMTATLHWPPHVSKSIRPRNTVAN